MTRQMEFGTGNLKQHSGSTIILLTGCINPEGMAFTKLQNPDIRREQYLQAISFYLSRYSLPVLFVENSNYDITPYLPADIDRDRIEVITFSGNNFEKHLGKGYGEMAIINEAILRSAFFSTANFVIKITGRHRVLNLGSIIDQYLTLPGTDILADLRDMGKYADSRCWGASVRFITNVFIKFWKDVNDSEGINFEHVLAKAIHQSMLLDYQFEQMKNLARLSGSSGTENQQFDDSWLRWFPRDLVHQIKYILNRR